MGGTGGENFTVISSPPTMNRNKLTVEPGGEKDKSQVLLKEHRELGRSTKPREVAEGCEYK